MTTIEAIPRESEIATAVTPLKLAFVAPRHPDGSDWPWLSQVEPMSRHTFRRIYIQNTFERWPKATTPYLRWQYLRAMNAIRGCDLAFFFSVQINLNMTRWPAGLMRPPRRVYVGFTQDGPWPQKTIDALAAAMRKLDAVTVFSSDERDLYIKRYGLEPSRVRLIHIHTDEPHGYDRYDGGRPRPDDYLLSLGSPNRRFTPLARACRELGIPLVIITRPWHDNDSLDELAGLGATIITNADKVKSLTYLKHARLTAMCFKQPELPGAFTTLIHAMFLGTLSIVTSCLGIADYIVEGESGVVTPHGDDQGLKSAIDRLWNDHERRHKLVEGGRERARRLFSLEAAAGRFDELAREIVGR